MGNTNTPAEYNGATCGDCRKSLRALKDWDDLIQQYIDRGDGVRREYHVFFQGIYYRPTNVWHYYCPDCFWRPKIVREQRQQEEERRRKKKQRQQEEERKKEEQKQQELKRWQEAQEVKRKKEESEKRRLEEQRQREEVDRQYQIWLEEENKRKQVQREEEQRQEEARKWAEWKAQEKKRLEEEEQKLLEQLRKEAQERKEREKAHQLQREREQREAELKEKMRQEEEQQWCRKLTKWNKVNEEKKVREQREFELKEKMRQEEDQQWCRKLTKWNKVNEERKVREHVLQRYYNQNKIQEETCNSDNTKPERYDSVELNVEEIRLQLLNVNSKGLSYNRQELSQVVAYALSLIQTGNGEHGAGPDMITELLIDTIYTVFANTPDNELLHFTKALVMSTTLWNLSESDGDEMNTLADFFFLTASHGEYQNESWVGDCIIIYALYTWNETVSQLCSNLVRNSLWSVEEFRQFEDLCKEKQHLDVLEILRHSLLHAINGNVILKAASESGDTQAIIDSTRALDQERSLSQIFNEMLSQREIPEKLLLEALSLSTSVATELDEIHVGLIERHQKKSIQRLKLLKISKNISDASDAQLKVIITALCCSVWLKMGYRPHYNQLFTLALMTVMKRNRESSLLQVPTGEGKSCIIAMFAALAGLFGIKVDIITSSPLLAVRDSKDWEAFYDEFRLTSSSIIEDSANEKQALYSKNIVYCTVSSLAADILQQEFQMKVVRGDRSFEMVIIDEVDMLMLDEGVQFTYLSHMTTGLSHLEPLLANIWSVVSCYQPVFLDEKESVCCVPQLFFDALFSIFEQAGLQSTEQLIEMLENKGLFEQGFTNKYYSLNEEGKNSYSKLMTVEKMSECLSFISEQLKVSFTVYEKKENKFQRRLSKEDAGKSSIKLVLLDDGMACNVLEKEQIVADIANSIKSQIHYTNDLDNANTDKLQSNVILPQFLCNYVDNSLPSFVRNAFIARKMTRERQYLVGEHEIFPVDFDSSGITQKNKKWGDGLQQFLEMKEGIKVSALSIVTNFMSNVCLFERYMKSGTMHGLSGTLGDKAERNFLKNFWRANVCNIPAHKKPKTFEMAPIFASNRDEWKQGILESIEKVANSGRVSLLICEDIGVANEMQKWLTDAFNSTPGSRSKVVLYSRSDTNEVYAANQTFSSGAVVVATNIAGRGTDIRMDDCVESSGGLHVVVTFLPKNRRVELQAFGRAGRKGWPGSCQLILNLSAIPDSYRGNNIREIRNIVDEKQEMAIATMENSTLKEINTQEQLFAYYCIQLREVHNMLKRQTQLEAFQKAQIDALNEWWGLWLQFNTEKIVGGDSTIENFESELKVAKRKIRMEKSPTGNPYHLIKYANQIVDENPKGAMGVYNEAIKMADGWTLAAFYNRAYCRIKIAESKGTNSQVLQDAISDLEEADLRLQMLVDETLFVQNCLEASVRLCSSNLTNSGSDLPSLQKQIETRNKVYSSMRENIKKLTEKLNDFKRNNKEIVAEAVGVFSLVPDADFYTQQELLGLHSLGLIVTFDVKEKPKFNWDALAVFFIGLAQCLAGAFVCLVSCGLLTTIGSGLISEGVSDMIEGVQGMITGKFDWKEWGIAKAISLAITVICGAVKAVMKAGMQGVKATLKEAATQIKQIPNLLKQGFTSAARSNLKTIAKITGKEIVQQGVMKGIEFLEQHELNKLSEAIKERVKERVKPKYVDVLIQNQTYRMIVARLIAAYCRGGRIDHHFTRKLKDGFEKIGHQSVQQFLETTAHLNKVMNIVHQVKDNLFENSKNKILKIGLEATMQLAVIQNAISEILKINYTFIEILPKMAEEFFQICELPSITDHNEILQQVPKDELRNLQNDLGETLAEVYSSTFSNIFEQGVSSQIMRTLNITVNQKLRKSISNKLGTERTLNDLHAGANANYLTVMPLQKQQHTPKDSERVAYAKTMGSSQEPGSLLEVRVLAKLMDTNIVIHDVSPSGKKQKRAHIRESKTEQHIELLYHPPDEKNKIGHYDVMSGGKYVQIYTNDNDCLFIAIARARNPHLGETESKSEAVRLRKHCVQEIASNAAWEPFVLRKLLLANHQRFAAIGGARDDKAHKRVLAGNYPHGKLVIEKGDEKHMAALNKLKRKLSEIYVQNDNFENSKTKNQQSEIAATGSEPVVTFGTAGKQEKEHLKRSFMLGSLEVVLVKGNSKKTVKLLAMSGDLELKFRNKKFDFEYDGFQLINSPMPTGPICDLSGQSRDNQVKTPKWESLASGGKAKSCSAKKLMAHIPELLQSNYIGYRVDSNSPLKMTEVFHNGKGDKMPNKTWSERLPVQSCSECRACLPIATGLGEMQMAEIVTKFQAK